jgi:hypothetical protein
VQSESDSPDINGNVQPCLSEKAEASMTKEIGFDAQRFLSKTNRQRNWGSLTKEQLEQVESFARSTLENTLNTVPSPPISLESLEGDYDHKEDDTAEFVSGEVTDITEFADRLKEELHDWVEAATCLLQCRGELRHPTQDPSLRKPGSVSRTEQFDEKYGPEQGAEVRKSIAGIGGKHSAHARKMKKLRGA